MALKEVLTQLANAYLRGEQDRTGVTARRRGDEANLRAQALHALALKKGDSDLATAAQGREAGGLDIEATKIKLAEEDKRRKALLAMGLTPEQIVRNEEEQRKAGLADTVAGTGVKTANAAYLTARPGLEREEIAGRERVARINQQDSGRPIRVETVNPETGEPMTTFVTPQQAQAIASGQAPGLGKAPGMTERNRIAAARNSNESGNLLLKELADPEFQAVLGPVTGRYNSLIAAAGSGDPTAQYLVGALKSFAGFQPAVHGFRAIAFQKDIEDALSTKQTPESLSAIIRGIMTAGKIVARPHGQSTAPGGLSAEEEDVLANLPGSRD